MTLDDLLTMTLVQRIAWLHSAEGPHGYMSHDTFATKLGTSRQVVIGWENGVEPKQFATKLAEFSGFPREAFLRREAEELAQGLIFHRMKQAEDDFALWRKMVLEGFELLGLSVNTEAPQGSPLVRLRPRRKTS